MTAAFVAAFTFAMAVEAAECGKHDKVVAFLAKKYRETRRAVALANTNPPTISELYVSGSGTWTLLLKYPGGMTCVAAAGHAWERTEDPPARLAPHTF